MLKTNRKIKVLVTGGAGFIGRWVVKKLLEKDCHIWIIDNLENGSEENIGEFKNDANLKDLIIGDVVNRNDIISIFKEKFDICIHLAAQINVHESLENPSKSFYSNVIGTYNILEEAKKHTVKLVLLGTCMVYDMAGNNGAISENSPIKPASPYAGSKLAAENLADSYAYGFGLPVVILRPFNTYGPFQKSNMEGGVVSVFIKSFLENRPLPVFGDGTQTRDFLYIEDCADFIVRASFSKKTNREVLNAGLGKDIAIKDLAFMICKDSAKIQFVPHLHPQSEIKKLVCNNSKARRILNWEPQTSLEEGIEKTKEWIKANYLLV